jgi:hypothetical protein
MHPTKCAYVEPKGGPVEAPADEGSESSTAKRYVASPLRSASAEQGLTLVPISAQLELTSPLSA